jgi:hypothetical protein
MPGVAFMRSARLLVSLAAAVGCASSGSPGPDLAPAGQRTVAVDDQQVYRTSVAVNAKVPIPAPPSRVFDALKTVYADLGVPPATHDPATGRIGNTDFWKSRRFANEPISSFLSCGETFTGSAADNYRIYMSLQSVVRPDGKGASELETAFSASAQNMEGTSSDRIACGSTGKLEERIRKAVLVKLAPAGL